MSFIGHRSPSVGFGDLRELVHVHEIPGPDRGPRVYGRYARVHRDVPDSRVCNALGSDHSVGADHRSHDRGDARHLRRQRARRWRAIS